MEFHIREAAEATDVYLSRRCLLWTGQYTHKVRGKGQGFKNICTAISEMRYLRK